MREAARAADLAVSRDLAQMRRFYGYKDGEQYTGFERYWHTTAGHSPGPEAGVTERVALAQIWPRLRPEHRAALAALSAHDDYGLAAGELGFSRAHFRNRISTARRDFLRLWHEGEPPSRPWAYDLRGTRAVDPLASANRTIAARRRARGKLRRPAPPGAGRPRKDLGIPDAELARRYQDGQSIRQIAASLGVYPSIVRNRLMAQGVQLRPANGRRQQNANQAPARVSSIPVPPDCRPVSAGCPTASGANAGREPVDLLGEGGEHSPTDRPI
jgi:hypothetical protein